MTNEPYFKSQRHLFSYSFLPSLKRTLSALFSGFGLIFFALTVIGGVSLLVRYGVIELDGYLAKILGYYHFAIDWFVGRFGEYDLDVIRPWVDSFLIYLSFGNTLAKAEKDELLAVTIEHSERSARFKEAFTKLKADAFFHAIPRLIRGPTLRLLWPFVLLYRFSIPFIVEGPGPSGDVISSNVAGKDFKKFAEMVAENTDWNEQTVYDQRQVALWHFVIVTISNFAIAYFSSIF